VNTIYKYEFEIKDRFSLLLPAASNFLKAEIQNGTPCLWVMHQTDAPKRNYHFRIIGTGREVPSNFVEHISTFQMEQFVWHLFHTVE
jgi:hypothetical protein